MRGENMYFKLKVDDLEFEGRVTHFFRGRLSGPPDRCSPPECEWQIDSVSGPDGAIEDFDPLVEKYEDLINDTAWNRATNGGHHDS